MLRIRNYFKIFVVAFSALQISFAFSNSNASAQDDPFGDASGFGDGGFGDSDVGFEAEGPGTAATGANATDLPPLERDANIVVRMLREDPPDTLLEIGRAITLMNRLENWPETGRYIDQLGSFLESPGAAAELVRTYGTDIWIALAVQSELTDPQRAIARKILDEVVSAQRAPQTISAALKDLQSNSPVVRKAGAIRIQRAGSVGLQSLIESVGNNSTPVNDTVVDLIHSFGRAGHDALSASMTTRDTARRNRLLYAGCAFASYGMLPHLAAGLYTPDVDARTLQAIEAVFARNNRTKPTEAQVRAFLLKQIGDELGNAQSVRYDTTSEPLTPVWYTLPERSTVTRANVPEADWYLQKAAEKAFSLLHMGPGIDEAAVLATAALLQRDYAFVQSVDLLQIIDLRTDAPLESRSELIGPRQSDVAFWISVYKTSEVNRLPAAQLRAIQQLGKLASNPALQSELIETLISASKSTVPAVRFAALEALSEIESSARNPQVTAAVKNARSYQGSFTGSPVALIIGGASDLRQTAIDQLAVLGVQTIEASSGREAIRSLQKAIPFEFVIIVDRISDMSLSQIVQRVNAYPPTASIPIAILTNNVTGGEQLILRDFPQIVYGTLTYSENYMQNTIERMNRAAGIPLPSQSDRIIWTGLLSDPIQD